MKVRAELAREWELQHPRVDPSDDVNWVRIPFHRYWSFLAGFDAGLDRALGLCQTGVGCQCFDRIKNERSPDKTVPEDK